MYKSEFVCGIFICLEALMKNGHIRSDPSGNQNISRKKNLYNPNNYMKTSRRIFFYILSLKVANGSQRIMSIVIT